MLNDTNGGTQGNNEPAYGTPEWDELMAVHARRRRAIAIDAELLTTLVAMAADTAWTSNDAARRTKARIEKREALVRKGKAEGLDVKFLEEDRDMLQKAEQHTQLGIHAIRAAAALVGADETSFGVTEERFGAAVHQVPSPDTRLPRQEPALNAEQAEAMLIAMHVRNSMEDFHVDHLSDAEMAVLNPIIRNAIYEVLWALSDREKSDLERKASGNIIDFLRKCMPHYWEAPQFTEDTARYMTYLETGEYPDDDEEEKVRAPGAALRPAPPGH